MSTEAVLGIYKQSMVPLLASIIMTNTNAYSSTGGNVVGPGETVIQGSSYSSVMNETIDGSGQSGTATMYTETINNGKVDSQTMTKAIPPGGSIEIEVATSSGSAASWVRTASIVSPGISSVSASTSLKSLQQAVYKLFIDTMSTSASTSIAINTTGSTSTNFAQIGFGTQIKLFFKQLFSIFGF
jgi:hypothetical protein